MISGLNSTGHEIGGTIGIAIFSTIAAGSGALAGPQAASGIAHAFIAAATPRYCRQPGRPGRPAAGTPLRAEAAAEPQRDADPLTMAKPATTSQAPAPKRRRADADRSVAAILDAGLEALASDPDSSMSEIARRAGVVRATIYVHFPTRDRLLDAVMEYAVGRSSRR